MIAQLIHYLGCFREIRQGAASRKWKSQEASNRKLSPRSFEVHFNSGKVTHQNHHALVKPDNEANPDHPHYEEGEEVWCSGESVEAALDQDNELRLTTRTGRHIKSPNWMKDYVTSYMLKSFFALLDLVLCDHMCQ